MVRFSLNLISALVVGALVVGGLVWASVGAASGVGVASGTSAGLLGGEKPPDATIDVPKSR